MAEFNKVTLGGGEPPDSATVDTVKRKVGENQSTQDLLIANLLDRRDGNSKLSTEKVIEYTGRVAHCLGEEFLCVGFSVCIPEFD